MGIVLAVLIACTVLLIELLPWLGPLMPLPALAFDLSTNLTGQAAALVTNKSVTAHLALGHTSRGDLLTTARGQLLDWPYTLQVRTDLSLLTLKACGDFDFSLDGTPWRVSGTFAATPRTWRAAVRMDETAFDEKEPVIASILARLPLPGITNLVFAGALDFTAMAEKTRKIPVPAWSARGHLARLNASCELNGKPLVLTGLKTDFGADGIADRVTIAPFHPHIDTLEGAGLALSKVFANVRKTEAGFLVTEAGAGFCGGDVRLYSLFLDPAKLNAGFTLFLDDIDANEIIRHLKGFHGTATGRLHGKIPLFLKNGRELRLRDSYLYSTPGEIGTLKLTDSTPILENLSLGGVSIDACENLSKALANLSYSVLKFDLKRDADGALALSLRVEGSATHEKITVPVSFDVTFHGDIEQLVNTGLKAIRK